VRLDDSNLLSGEAMLNGNSIYVPAAFAPVVGLKRNTARFDTVPDNLAVLADRWVYTVQRPAGNLPPGMDILDTKDGRYINLLEVADASNRAVTRHPSGLVLIGEDAAQFSTWSETERDAVITLFDTPEKFADPDLATKYIPLLALQQPWYEHAASTPEQRAALAQPEPEWPETPRSEYSLEGFNTALLGSNVPEPGIYPRLLFSSADLPLFRDRIRQNKLAQKSMTEIAVLLNQSWLDPTTSDGQVFDKLAGGVTEGLLPLDAQGNPIPGFYGTYPDQKPGISFSHIKYNAQCLATIAMYALLTDNPELGQKTANAIATYCRMGEAAIDHHLATSDSEWGTDYNKANNASTHWRGMHAIVPSDLPFLLDFGGYYMNAEQKDMMRRIIAKATYGRRTGGGDGPRRCWRDNNHVTWHLTHGLALTAIEGLEGFDPEGYASHAELTRDFLEWGVDRFGQMFESNGKSGGGIQYQILSMIALARRGDNLWGHPHWRALLEGQLYTTAPNGQTTLSSGTWGSSPFSTKAVNKIMAFYPENRFGDYLMTLSDPGLDLAAFDVETYRQQLEAPRGTHRVRLPGIAYPDFAFNVLYDTDWTITRREDLSAKTDWNDTVHGILSTYSDLSPEAAWMCLHIRDNHYMGAGHHHADVGMFYFSGEGINWFPESPMVKTYDGNLHNLVRIDGISQADAPPARGHYLGAVVRPVGALGTADLSYAYSWRWSTQVMLWGDKWMTTRGTRGSWELEADPEILAYYQGTERYKMRPWWPTYTFANFMPTVRAPYNPVKYAYRTAGLVRGKHPYGLVVDDLKKDDRSRRYQWCGILGPGVWQARSDELPRNQVWLAWDGSDKRHHAGERFLYPKRGQPVLLACALGLPDPDPDGPRALGVQSLAGPPDRDTAQTFYDALLANVTGEQARYRMLLIPMKAGDPVPDIGYDTTRGTATITWPDQTDVLTFTVGTEGRTSVSVRRESQEILVSLSADTDSDVAHVQKEYP
jgi:hypothetical protein